MGVQVELSPALYDLVTRRASYQVKLKYGLNKSELRLLMQLVAMLAAEDQAFVAVDTLFRNVTGNSTEWTRMFGYLSGLLRRRMVGSFEYIRMPGSLSVGPSELGLAVVRCYEEEIGKIAAKYQPKRVVVSYEEFTPSYYRVRSVA